MPDRLVEQLDRLLVVAQERVVLGEEVERPDVFGRIGVGRRGGGCGVGEGGEEGGDGAFNRFALRGGAIERLEVDEEGGHAFLKASLEVRSNELIEFVS